MTFINATTNAAHARTGVDAVNCLKPKVFIGRTSIRQFRGFAEKFAAARASANAEFVYAKA
jgi:hypothetical protein